MRRAHRLDGSHAAIVAELEARGASVLSLAGVGSGCPDLLIGYRRRMALVEIKDGDKPPSKRRLTPDQAEFMLKWHGPPVLIVSRAEDVAETLKWLL